MILQPRPRSILFISEAPPQDGGFWTVQAQTSKQDDLREKLLPLLKVASHGHDRGLSSFRDSGYFLLQSFPRPLKISVGNIKKDELKRLLQHPMETHLKGPDRLFITRRHPCARQTGIRRCLNALSNLLVRPLV